MRGTVSPDLNRLTKDLVPSQEHYPQSLPSSGCSQREGRRGIQDHERSLRLDALQGNIQKNPNTLWSRAMEIDLFALRLTKQLPTYVSWGPDPQALETDALSRSMNWKGLKAYANPPWHLISRVLCQVREQTATIVLKVPVWKTQAWYFLLLELLIEIPLDLTVGQRT